jgi:glycosyltransferase XagB
MSKLDVIIPVHNESDNIVELLRRLEKVLVKAEIKYKIIVVDNASTDNTDTKVINYTRKYSSKVELCYEEKRLGKAYAILKGISVGKSDFIAMIDGDLQYPPEAIPLMFKLAQTKGMVVANRLKNETGFLRRLGTNLNRIIFEKKLLGLNCDTQSGLKVFNRGITRYLNEGDVKPWSIDMPLLITARKLGYKICSVDIEFKERKAGISKVSFIKTGLQIAVTAFKLKLFEGKPFIILPDNEKSTIGAGVVHKNRRFITHTNLALSDTALNTLNSYQKIFIGILLSSTLAGVYIDIKMTAIVFIAILSTLYFLDFLFTLLIVFKNATGTHELKFSERSLKNIDDKNLPIYSILCPLYKEAGILEQFINSINLLDWPKDKLDVILLLEADDEETISEAKRLGKYKHIRTIIVPQSLPKTKPKACNYGLAHAKGKYAVIYDAEDKPDPLQLKKAYLGFKNAPKNLACLQSKLNYYNPDQNILTKLFTAEYSLWFDLILPGLQAVKTIIPLGGTSNHFKLSVLRKLGGWDAFNVTEDCDLGTRLFKSGYKTAIIDSTTFEEANSKFKSWLKQRSRWIKGYLQTYFVHTRNPVKFIAEHGIQALLFQLIIGMRMVFIMINPILWLVTIIYFAFRSSVGPAIEALYPRPIFYMAVFPMVFGNFLYFYNYMIGCAIRGKWYLVKYVFLMPLYWLMVSMSSLIALYQLVIRPHYWEKTAHGLHLAKKSADKSGKEVRRYPAGEPETVSRPGWISTLATNNFTGASFLMVATGLNGFLAFAYNTYLGRNLLPSEFGLVGTVASLIYLINLPIYALSSTLSYRTSYLIGKFGGTASRFWIFIRRKVVFIALAATLIWLAVTPLMKIVFRSEDMLPFLLSFPIWVLAFLSATDRGFLAGNFKFAYLGVIILLEALLKFIFAFFFINFKLEYLIYSAIPLSMLLPYFMGYFTARKLKSDRKLAEKRLHYFPTKFYGLYLLLGLSSIGFLSIDIIMAKYFLDPIQAGYYALLSLIGKMIYYVGQIFSQFIFPVVSRAEGAKKDSLKAFFPIFIAGTISIVLISLVLGQFGVYSVPFLLGNVRGFSILPYLTPVVLGFMSYTLASLLVEYHMALRHYAFPLVGFLMAIVQVVLFIFHHDDVTAFTQVVFVSGAIYLATATTLHILYSPLTVIYHNLIDFLDIFKLRLNGKNALDGSKLRILVFNWRDIKHVWAGGAEVYIHELAKRWVKKGHNVTIFCGNDGKNKREEVIDGVRIIRRGGFYTVYIWAFLYYIARFRRRFDVVIDSENGIPFFTPLYVNQPVVGLIHHVHRDIILKELELSKFLLPVAYIAKQLEVRLMPYVYRNSQMVTVSESTKKDLESIGFGKLQPISVVNPGVDLTFLKKGKKTQTPTILYLGRLKAYKSIDTLIKAMPKILAKHPKAMLKIAGFGEARHSLENLVEKMNLGSKVEFLGKVSEEAKRKLLQESWVFAYPSRMEGWGIAAVEASASGTVVVASDVPGLRDSVRNPHTGILARYKDVDAFAESIDKVLSDTKFRKQLERNSIKYAKDFDWEKSADRFLFSVKECLAVPDESLAIATAD